jgi:hypothetical protein
MRFLVGKKLGRVFERLFLRKHYFGILLMTDFVGWEVSLIFTFSKGSLGILVARDSLMFAFREGSLRIFGMKRLL